MADSGINVRQHLRSRFWFDFKSLNDRDKCKCISLSLGPDSLHNKMAKVDDICNNWLILRVLVIEFSEFRVGFADKLYIFVGEAAGCGVLIWFFEHKL